MRYLFVVIIVCGSVGVPALAAAQGLEHSTIEGTVRDQTGAGLLDVTVTLSGTSLIGGSRTATTDDRGRFQFLLLPPGSYDLRGERPGFSPGQRTDLIVSLGATLSIDLVLPVSGVTEAVSVGAREPIIDLRNPASVTNIDQRTIQLLPLRRVYAEVLALAPGIANPTVVPGLVVAYGGTLGSNGLYVDGVDMTEPKRQGALLAVSLNWLDQVQVVGLGAGPQYGDFTGAAALGVLRSGSNRLSGFGEYWTSRWAWIDRNGSSLAGRETLSLWNASGQFGGPIRQDRLWYFAGLDLFRRADRPLGYTADARSSEVTPRSLVKLTAALARDARLEGHLQWNRLRRTGANASRFTAPDALSEQTQRDASWNVRVTKPLGHEWLLETRTGGYASEYSDRPMPPRSIDGPPGTIETTTNVASGNTVSYRRQRPLQTNSIVSATRLLSGRTGEHAVRGGVEFKWSKAVDASGFSGGERRVTTAGRPIAIQMWEGDETTALGRRAAFYLQDRWTVGERVTIDGGLRVDVNRGSIPARGTVLATTPVAPRLGMAWALDGQGRSALKLTAGRYYDTLLTERVAFMDIPGLRPLYFYAVDASGVATLVQQSPPLTARGIDPEIRHSFVDQYVVAYEREVFAQALFSAKYIRRRFDDFMAIVETRREWAPVSFADPGEDGALGTPDDGGSFTAYRLLNPVDAFLWLTNPDDAYRQYDAVQGVLQKRWSDRWQLQATYTWSRTAGTVGNSDYTNAGLNDTGELTGTLVPGTFVNPNAGINADGRAPYDIREFKVIGGYALDAAGGLVVSGILQHRNGARWERKVTVFNTLIPNDFQTIRLEPRGSRTLPSIWNLDLRVEKTLRGLGVGREIGVAFDVFNVTNQGGVLFAYPIVGPSFGMALTRSDPRTLRVVARVAF